MSPRALNTRRVHTSYIVTLLHDNGASGSALAITAGASGTIDFPVRHFFGFRQLFHRFYTKTVALGFSPGEETDDRMITGLWIPIDDLLRSDSEGSDRSLGVGGRPGQKIQPAGQLSHTSHASPPPSQIYGAQALRARQPCVRAPITQRSRGADMGDVVGAGGRRRKRCVP